MQENPIKILMIEDHLEAATTLKDELLDIGCQITGVAPSAEEIPLLIAGNQPDLVVLGLHSKGESERSSIAETVSGRYNLPVKLATGQSSTYIRERQKHFWLSTALNSAADGIVIVNYRGQVQYLNPVAQNLSGWSQQQASGQHHATVLLFEHGDNRITDDLVRLATLNEEPLSLGQELFLVSRDGRRQQIEAEVSAGDGASGASASAVFTLRDITRRTWEELQHRQEHTIRAVERLAETTSHSLNDLLTSILGNADLLLSIPDLSREQRDIGSEIQSAAQKIEDVVRQLSAITRTKYVSHKELNVNEVIASFVALSFNTILPGIELRLNLDPTLLNVSVDQGQLETILFTLVTNAREASLPGGEIIISTHNLTIDIPERLKAARNFVRVTVQDTGEGMTKETTERMFEPFFTLRSGEGHLGLGLSIAQGIIRDYKGFIDVKSERGVGTEIIFGIPTIETDLFSYLDETVPGPESAPLPKTIFIVEDDNSVRLLVRKILEKHGYRVIEARDGEDALLVAQLHEGHIDLVITDVVMPRMAGPELIRRFAPLHPEAKFLLISGFPSDKINDAASLTQGIAFLKKPFKQTDLIVHIQGLLLDAHIGPIIPQG